MNIPTKKRVSVIVILFLALLVNPRTTFAHVQFTPVALPENNGGTIAIQIRVATDHDTINTVEGMISIPNDISEVTISTGDSAFTLWPTPPVFSVGDRTVSFTAGAPGGIKEGKDVLLFTIYGRTTKLGDFTFTPLNTSAYLHDGKGTKVPSEANSLKFSVQSLDASKHNAFSNAISSDHSAPVVDATVGQDTYLFDGQYFLSVYGTDGGSGIARFEVAEGWSGFKESKEYHILQDQKQGSIIRVRATDFAGNSKVEYIWPAHPFAHPLFYLDVLGVVLILVLVWRRVRIRTMKDTSVSEL